MLPSTQSWFTRAFFLASLLSLFLSARVSSAADDPHTALVMPAVEQEASPSGAPALICQPGETGITQSLCPKPAKHRPDTLYPLYGSLVVLAGFDVHSTLAALRNGGHEANPVARSLLGSPVAMPILKAAGVGTIVYASERLWKRNTAAAVLTMIAVNSAYAVIVSHNYRIARR